MLHQKTLFVYDIQKILNVLKKIAFKRLNFPENTGIAASMIGIAVVAAIADSCQEGLIDSIAGKSAL